ncbi:outer membrane putative beta-barrel porin/alpha-amylase [Geothermobacter ehrlichii]|uniref:Outer membrane putative beta-barrel porin/alpha-amylase n=1 Tax=Geothermobacter ehrlichii TaxID=213224 RepID=A0A5D3WJG7_9BACT|nr:transporter [Geothermobacter ehrlichii]TYO98441.1 outer membrane putative beta-barrel porin/alpha-amylase [Geothermobacter ehrlichii]
MKKSMKWILFGFALVGFLTLGVVPAWSAPGLLQLASRAGFWANDFPDTAMLIQHFYHYSSDEIWVGDGEKQESQDLTIEASFTRLVRAWHFGEDKQYQYVLEGIVPLYNLSGEETSRDAGDNFSLSGLGHPLIYTSLGWNNPTKTTHIQSFLIWQVPVGDSDIMNAIGGNNHALMPGLGVQERFGNIWLDGSVGYLYNFEDLDSDAKARDVFEVNSSVSYRFSAPYPWWIYMQGDYTRYMEGDDENGNNLGNDGHNYAIAPGIGACIRPNMTLDVKYTMDVDGENTSKGNAINVRFFWAF